MYFYDNFERADETPIGEPWDALSVNLANSHAVTEGGFACMFYPAVDKSQRMRVAFMLFQQGDASDWVLFHLRVNDSVDTSTALLVQQTLDRSYACKVTYDAAGARKLGLYKLHPTVNYPGNILLLTEISYPTGSGTFKEVGGSSVLVLQDLIFEARDIDNGTSVRLKAWLNTTDDNPPTITFDDRGRTSTGSVLGYETYHDPGKFGISFGNTGVGTGKYTVIKAVEFEDGLDQEKAFPAHSLTAGDIIDMILEDSDRSSNTDLSRTTVLRYVERAQQRLYAELGWSSFFWRRNGSMPIESLELDRVKLPRYVRMVEEMRASDRRLVPFEWLGSDDEGRLVLYIPNGQASTVVEFTYYIKPPTLLTETDPIMVPREFAAALVEIALVNVAKFDSDAGAEAAAREDSARWIELCRREGDRMRMMSRNRERLIGYNQTPMSRYVPANQLYGGWPR